MRKLIRLAAGLLAAASIAGCTAATPTPDAPSVLPTQTAAGDSSLPVAAATATPEAIIPTIQAPDPVAVATEALADRLGVSESAILYVDSIQVDWQDTSLGCPQPDEGYLQVMTPGYLVRLASGDTTYEVHTDLVGTAIICGEVGGEAEGVIRDPIVAEFAAQARADLAAQLGVPADQIAMVRSEAVEWSNSTLGCADAGSGEIIDAATTGYRIVLALGEDRFEYHTDQQRMILCAAPTE